VFDVPSTQVVFDSARWLSFPTTTPINSRGPFQFQISDSRCYLHTAKCYVSFRLRVTKEKQESNVAVCNYLGGAFFSQVKVCP